MRGPGGFELGRHQRLRHFLKLRVKGGSEADAERIALLRVARMIARRAGMPLTELDRIRIGLNPVGGVEVRMKMGYGYDMYPMGESGQPNWQAFRRKIKDSIRRKFRR